jgi:hypothetical protein
MFGAEACAPASQEWQINPPAFFHDVAAMYLYSVMPSTAAACYILNILTGWREPFIPFTRAPNRFVTDNHTALEQ